MKKLSLFLITALLLTGCSSTENEMQSQANTEVQSETKTETKNEGQSDQVSMNTAILKTSMGEITIELFPNQAPKTVKNFIGLADGTGEWTDLKTGKKADKALYDGTIFHRVIPGFMIQGGDPLGSGRGGPGYQFEDEFHPELVFDKPYLLAMANAGPGTNGSQFFVTVAATAWLNRKHTIFGEVADQESRDVVDKIAATPTGAMDKPSKDVVINNIEIS